MGGGLAAVAWRLDYLKSRDSIRITGDCFKDWLRRIARLLADRKLCATGPYSFPTLLRIAESPDHFIAELCGSSYPRHPTNVNLHRPRVSEHVRSATSYLNSGFDARDPELAQFVFQGENTMHRLTMATAYDKAAFERKLNWRLNDTVLMGSFSDVPIGVLPTANRILLSNIDIVRTDDIRVLYRTIATAICVQKAIAAEDLKNWIDHECHGSMRRRSPLGMNLRYEPSTEGFARELSSLADQNVTELVLDAFIQTHGDTFQAALNYCLHVSQPHLKWIRRSSHDPETSRPDYMLKRSDGFWDILDLKRGALRQQSIVQGIPSRPRFIAYVNEMIAQLVRYQSYFEISENAKWAAETYGIRVRDVRLIGVVGNYDIGTI
jgi:hypothetical protein